jgi:hypothetical protein
MYCKECGTEVQEGPFCSGCGVALKQPTKLRNKIEDRNNFRETSIIQNAHERKKNLNPKKYLLMILKELITQKPVIIIGIFIGIIIILISQLIIQKDPERIILDIIGGFTASFIAGGTIKNGLVNGAIVGILGGALAVIYTGVGGETDILPYMIGVSLAIMIFGLIGGLIGILSRKLLFK